MEGEEEGGRQERRGGGCVCGEDGRGREGRMRGGGGDVGEERVSHPLPLARCPCTLVVDSTLDNREWHVYFRGLVRWVHLVLVSVCHLQACHRCFRLHVVCCLTEVRDNEAGLECRVNSDGTKIIVRVAHVLRCQSVL